MKQLVNLPFQKAYVRKRFLRQETKDEGIIECYLIAVEVVLNEALRWMVMTREGACFSSVPLHALCLKENAPDVELASVCTWDALGNRAEIVELEFLRHFTVQSKHGTGRYMFSIHFEADKFWSRLPSQLKVMHLAEREDGNLMIVVANESRFVCDAITDEAAEMTCIPQSNQRIWFAEE